jgi:hypothetical protein
MRRPFATLAALSAILVFAIPASARVLRVGSYHAIKGQYSSIQAAVRAAKPGDWILIGGGDYKTKPSSIRTPRGAPDFPAGLLITQGGLHIRGMNRNTVIVDGTKPGSGVCSRSASAQNFGLRGGGSEYGYARPARAASGVNGVMVWKAPNVSIENLTVCNFLGGSRDAGNGIWWNGGANSGQVGGHGFSGAYLTATSTFFQNEATVATYGIYSSNWTGGTWDQTYASNFNDSGYYIGACGQICDQTISHAWGEYNALGYSGSNSGGQLVVETSQFDNNEDGFVTNSLNGDNPPPQDGSCPHGGTSPITHTHSCWVFMHNYVHDNNNPNVPSAGSAAAGPVGTGMTVAGGRNDTIMDNRFVNNDAWGLALVPYTDNGSPCPGGTADSPLTGNGTCLWDDYGNAVVDNTFSHNGGYGNPTNGDFEQLNLEVHPDSCFSGNTDSGGSLNAAALALQQSYPCPETNAGTNLNLGFLNEVLCDSRVSLPPFGCQPSDHYPRRSQVIMHPLPKGLRTMPHPCQGVPSNPWCRRKA